MLLDPNVPTEYRELFQKIRLLNRDSLASRDEIAKIDQILAYLEVMKAQVRQYSRKRPLVLIDSGAGNCYLSFLAYHYFTRIEHRQIEMHCVEHDERLMAKNRKLAVESGYENMSFHACDIASFRYLGKPDLVYSLHACNDATDKTLYLGLKTEARNILSVSCCQHNLVRGIRAGLYTGITRHRIFKERLAYMAGDAMRACLMIGEGYRTDVIEFVSSRATDKNTMIRAVRGQRPATDDYLQEYRYLAKSFHLHPALADYLDKVQKPAPSKCVEPACCAMQA